MYGCLLDQDLESESLSYLLVCELLTEVGHDVSKLSRADETVAVLVKYLQERTKEIG